MALVGGNERWMLSQTRPCRMACESRLVQGYTSMNQFRPVREEAEENCWFHWPYAVPYFRRRCQMLRVGFTILPFGAKFGYQLIDYR
jgi:hypothetical protein